MIQREHEKLVELFKMGLIDHCMSASGQRANDFFISIKNLLHEPLTKLLSSRLLIRARSDHQTIKTIDHVRKN